MSSPAPNDNDMSPGLKPVWQWNTAHVDTTATRPGRFAGLKIQSMQLRPFRDGSVLVGMRKMTLLVRHVRLTGKDDIACQKEGL